MTFSYHRCLGLPAGLLPIGFQSNRFLVALAWPILCIWPSHLILCALMNLTISAPSINLSISMLLCIPHILSILTGTNIFLSICLSKMRRFFSSFAVKVQLSDEYVMTGLIIVLHIWDWVDGDDNVHRVGLDLYEGTIRDNRKAGVLEPAISKIKSLKFATEAAITILRIDDMIRLDPERRDRSYRDDYE